MSLLMNMLQQSQINKSQTSEASMEGRLDHLEDKVESQGRLLHELVVRLEKRLGANLEESAEV